MANAIAVFSNPFEGNFASLANELSLRQFTLVCKEVLSTGERERMEDVQAIEEVCERLESADPDTIFFSPEIGLTLYTLKHETLTAESWKWLSAQVQVAAFLSGVLEQIELELRSRRTLFAGNRGIDGASLLISGESGRLCITASDPARKLSLQQITTAIGEPVWVLEEDVSNIVEFGSASTKLVTNGHDGWILDPSRDHTPVQNPSQYLAQFQEAGGLLEAVAPEYYVWIACILRYIVPIVRRDERTIGSSSNFFVPMISQITAPAAPSETAEMLVHECSHQYVNLALRFGPMQTQGAKEHYSPLTKTLRPLDRILVGYHAFANVLLLYERMLQEGAEVLPARVETTSEYIVELEGVLEREAETGLTAFGQAIYYPLRNRLTEARKRVH